LVVDQAFVETSELRQLCIRRRDSETAILTFDKDAVMRTQLYSANDGKFEGLTLKATPEGAGSNG
jgi:hypothetical protein